MANKDKKKSTNNLKDCVLTRLDHGRSGLNHNLKLQKIKGKIINTLVKPKDKGVSDKKHWLPTHIKAEERILGRTKALEFFSF